MEITFPNAEPVYMPDTTVVFPAQVNGNKAICAISEEALQDHCGAASRTPYDLINAFKAHRARIEMVARRKYSAMADRWLLVSNDF